MLITNFLQHGYATVLNKKLDLHNSCGAVAALTPNNYGAVFVVDQMCHQISNA